MTDTTLPPPPYPADTRAKGWRFELDYEKINQSDTWDLAAEVPLAQHALLMMWLVSWTQEPCGSFPDNEDVIRAKCKIPAKQWAAMRHVLMRGWSKADDGRLYHPTITARVHDMLVKRAKDAKRAADKRARDADSRTTPSGITDASRVTHDGVGPEFDTKHQAPEPIQHSGSSIPPAVGSAKSPRASRKCPASFEVEPSAQQWVAESCPGVDWQRETEKFRDHTFKTAIADWPGAWRNWMRRAVETPRPAAAAETPYQRSMRERAQQAVPSIAAKAPNAKAIAPNPMEVLDGLTRITG